MLKYVFVFLLFSNIAHAACLDWGYDVNNNRVCLLSDSSVARSLGLDYRPGAERICFNRCYANNELTRACIARCLERGR